MVLDNLENRSFTTHFTFHLGRNLLKILKQEDIFGLVENFHHLPPLLLEAETLLVPGSHSESLESVITKHKID